MLLLAYMSYLQSTLGVDAPVEADGEYFGFQAADMIYGVKGIIPALFYNSLYDKS